VGQSPAESVALAESRSVAESAGVAESVREAESVAEGASVEGPSVLEPSVDFGPSVDASPGPESAAGGAGGFVSSPAQPTRIEPAARVATAKRTALRREERGRVRMAAYAPARIDVAFVLRTRET
jgi:hypothetical protein